VGCTHLFSIVLVAAVVLLLVILVVVVVVVIVVAIEVLMIKFKNVVFVVLAALVIGM
jgi:hypothetical protein